MVAPIQQNSTLIAIFDDRLEAERAVKDLEAAGFNADRVGYAIRGSDVGSGGMITDTVGTKDGRGAVAGALTGGLAGGILAAAVTTLLPGVGPIVAAGALAMMVGYAGAGAAIGGILGAMIGLGVSEEEAHNYEKLFKEGKAIVALRDPTSLGRQILSLHGAYHMHDVLKSPVKTAGAFNEP